MRVKIVIVRERVNQRDLTVRTHRDRRHTHAEGNGIICCQPPSEQRE